uniref:Uncharacterized protein n=1 Tax=Rhizophagus irregularis (strain DAOM 181602 / DAOM 197198 / MUCL 43194) TaxID=747089 RepID=U9T341_RHIID
MYFNNNIIRFEQLNNNILRISGDMMKFPHVFLKNFETIFQKVDYGFESRTTGRIMGLIEVKKDDFKQGFAQATVQLESSLGRKRKANEMNLGLIKYGEL